MKNVIYADFIASKSQDGLMDGFAPKWMPPFLFDFQSHMVEWALRKGRSALFEDCGLGKTAQQLVWAENVHRATNRPVLILTPLAVSAQTVMEAEKFGVEVRRSDNGAVYPVTVTNYERLHHFNANDFAGLVCDESSILKSFDGAYRNQIVEFMRKLRYRLLCTATAAPNDYIELGNSAEALGELGFMDMLAKFFKNDQNTMDTGHKWRGSGGAKPKWRFRGHAEEPFWRWVSSWARAIRRPSDIGFDDSRFILPPMNEVEHVVEARTKAPDMLFSLPAVGLHEQREERRRTITERCEKVAALVDDEEPALVWCHMNEEGNLLQKLIPDCVQVSGSDSEESKEEKLLAFQSGKVRVLVTKPKIGAWGLNFQHCAHVTFFPSHSFEQYYQSVRRCWRFGQKRTVKVDIVTTEGEQGIKANLQRKAEAADVMFDSLVAHMNNALKIDRKSVANLKERIPSWL